MFFDFLFIALSFALLIFSANVFVKSAVGIANKLKCSPLLIGLTIVSVGTSLPELVISLMSASHQAEELALGNIIGSNISNILLILGGSAVIACIARPESFKKDASFLILATVFLVPFLFIGSLKWWAGVIMLLIFIAFVLNSVRNDRKKNACADEDDSTQSPWAEKSWGFVISLLVLSLVGIIFASNTLVTHAVIIAHKFGVSEEVIGLTIIAFGTSLPEMAASWVAAYKGRIDLALGNVMGSNIANITLILGLTSLTTPIVFYQGVAVDIGVMIVSALLLILIFAVKGKMSKFVGMSFLIGYFFYIFSMV